MILTPEQREQVRLCILRYCLQPTRVGLIAANLRGEGYSISRDQVQREINYLAHPQKDLLAAQQKLISPENAQYETTPNGRDYLAQQGQEEV